MMLRMEYLVCRTAKDGTKLWQYRREVAPSLRSILGCREIKHSLGTSDLGVAQKRWAEVHAQVEQRIAEAAAGRKSPAIAAYKAVQDHVRGDERAEEGLDYHLTSLLEQRSLDPYRKAAVEALLQRHESDGADNPPLSILFGRYYAEKKLRPKTKLEWDGVLKRFTAMVGNLPVRGITKAHVRDFKQTLLATKGRTGASLSPSTVKKTLGALAAVMAWAKDNDYVAVNPVEKITVEAADSDESGRLPYSAEDLKVIFGTKREGNANHWLPWLALYTGHGSKSWAN
jgi:uncharacterized protein DUF6538/integrase-like protein